MMKGQYHHACAVGLLCLCLNLILVEQTPRHRCTALITLSQEAKCYFWYGRVIQTKTGAPGHNSFIQTNTKKNFTHTPHNEQQNLNKLSRFFRQLELKQRAYIKKPSIGDLTVISEMSMCSG